MNMEERVRQQKYSKMILKELSGMFQKELQGIIPGVLISVTVVRTSPDLSSVRVYLSFMPSQHKETYLEKIRNESKEIRHVLGKRIRDSVRVIPELFFYFDDGADYASNIEKILSQS